MKYPAARDIFCVDGIEFECPICGNRDKEITGIKPDGRIYCRLCLAFTGRAAPPFAYSGGDGQLSLAYPLTEEQERVSCATLSAVESGKPVLIRAVTGAGKTELVYRSMEYFLKRKEAVCFCTPRRDVAIELEPRIKEAFPHVKVSLVYGGHTEDLVGDIVICTAHQLYRYKRYFDLLILDEIDAFPFAGNRLLRRFFIDSIKGTYILLSATPSADDLRLVEGAGGRIIALKARYHRMEIPVPQLVKYGLVPFFDIMERLRGFISCGKPCFIFAPTIERARTLGIMLRFLFKNGASVDSENPERKEIIDRFKSGFLDYLVCTSILERGITVKDLQIIVCDADHEVYDAPTLIQIAGRAGRKRGYEKGEVLFLSKTFSDRMRKAVETIEELNSDARLQGLLKEV